LKDSAVALKYDDFKSETRKRRKSETTVSFEEMKPKMCQKMLREFQGYKTGRKAWVLVSCGKQWCYHCGGVDGKIHQRRKATVLSQLKIDDIAIRELIFSVPERFRWLFFSRKGINQLVKAVKRIKEKYYGKKETIVNIHLFGDYEVNPQKFHPHINLQIIEDKGSDLFEKRLKEIKKTWIRALQHMGCEGLRTIDVKYYMVRERSELLKALMYMCRPHDVEHYENLSYEEKEFYMIEMKGFNFLRRWGKKDKEMPDLTEEKEIKEEIKKLKKYLGEDVRYNGEIKISEWSLTHEIGKDVIEIEKNFFIEKGGTDYDFKR